MTDARRIESAQVSRPNGSDDELVAGSSWLLWWKIGAQDMQRQISGYHSLDVFQSIRGISGLCLFAIIGFTIFLQMVFNRAVSLQAAITIAPMLILAIFVLLGYRWAMIGSMLIVSLDKLAGIIGVFLTKHGGMLVVHFSLVGLFSVLFRLAWWCVCMHAFYFALRVEQEMARIRLLDPALIE
jgi:hypothetical protein